MNRADANRDMARLLILVVALPALVGLAWDYWPAISAWARSPASPWWIVAALALSVAVFAAVVLWDALRRRPS